MNNKRQSNKLKTIKDKKQKQKSEKKNQSKTEKIIKKSFPLPPQPENYKQINEDYDIGKLELVDYKGNITECDIYGSPKKRFMNDITGITTFKERLDKGLIKEFKLNNKSLYIPKTINFEGSMMFPRPLSLPFVNHSENPEKLVKVVKKEGRALTNKNKATFSLKKPLKDKTTIPSFICQKIGNNNPNDRIYLIKMIDNFILQKKKEHKFDSEYVEKSSNIKALNNYKKKLNENMTNELYNGKIIPPPKQKDLILKYDSIRKAIYHTGLKNSSGKNGNGQFVNFDTYRKLYKIKGVGNENNIFKKFNFSSFKNKNKNNMNNTDDNKLSYSNENIMYKTIFSKNSENIPMMKKYSLKNNGGNKFKLYKDKIKERNQNNNEYLINEEKFKKTTTTEIDKINDESFNNNTFFINNKSQNFNNVNLYAPQNFFINNQMNINNNLTLEKYNKTANTFYQTSRQNLLKIKDNNISNIEKDNYSYISEDKKNDNNFLNKFKSGFNCKSIKDIRIKAAKENNLLKGFVNPEIKNELKLKIYKNKKKDCTLQNYINELELVKKVNKIALEKEKKINLFRDNLLKKKLEGKKIFELNSKK